MLYPENSLRVVSVTPKEASEILSYNFIHNRKLRSWHIDYLCREMQQGRFLETAEVHIMFRNGEPVLVNGQHTLHAIVKSQRTVRVTMRKTITKELGQVAMYYAFGHDTGLTRSFSDALGAYSISTEVGLTDRQTNSLSSAIKHIKNGFRTKGGHFKIAAPDMLEDIRTWAPQMHALLSATEHQDKTMSRYLQKAGILSMALVTLFHEPEMAFGFWRKIVVPEGVPSDNGILLARRYILESPRRQGSMKFVTSGKISRQLADCWNTYRAGGHRLISQAQDSIPERIRIDGTYWNGKQSLDFFPTRAGDYLLLTHFKT